MSFWVLNQMIDLGDFWHWIGSQRTGNGVVMVETYLESLKI
jgi:hypothetical protein